MPGSMHWQMNDTGAVKLIKTRIRLLVQPKSMRSIIDATQIAAFVERLQLPH